MQKKHIIQIAQVILLGLLVCFKMFVYPGIERQAMLTFNPTPRTLVLMAFWFLVGLVLALPNIFAKGKFKLNPIHLTIVLAAIAGIWGYIFLRLGPWISHHTLGLFFLAIGFFCVSSFKANHPDK